MNSYCPYCRVALAPQTAAVASCDSCGEEWGARTGFRACASCGEPVPIGGIWCPGCGQGEGEAEARADISSSTHPAGAAAGPAAPVTPGTATATASPGPPRVGWEDLRTGQVFPATDVPSRLEVQPGALSAASEGNTAQHGPDTATWVPRTGRRIPEYPQGTLLAGRYRLLRRIGQGGFANVYLADDIENLLHDEVAVKVPLLEEAPSVLVRRLRSQLKAWKVLSESHPDLVVRLHSVRRIKVDGIAAAGIFMEHMAGGSLGSMVESAWGGYPRTREQLSRLLDLHLQACRAVASLHEQGLLHCDIKPANLLLDAAQRRCKLSDFELVLEHQGAGKANGQRRGTLPYMAPECFVGRNSIASDVFALGASLYHLLCGRLPFQAVEPGLRDAPGHLPAINPLVPPDLVPVVLRCLEPIPEHRPQSVKDLIEDLLRLGLTGEGANTAPVNLAQLLLGNLSPEDLAFLVQSLEQHGYRSARSGGKEQTADLLEEYCYTVPPHEVLATNCTARQLAVLARAVGLDPEQVSGREELIARVLDAIGFREGPREVPGIETARAFVDGLVLELAHAGTRDEVVAMVHSGLGAIERTVDLLLGFFGQLLYGSGLGSYLARRTSGKAPERLTLGEKTGALRTLASQAPPFPLPDRVRSVFRWPLLPPLVFDDLDHLVRERNRLSHEPDLGGLAATQRFARTTLTGVAELLRKLGESAFVPRVVQVVSRQDDVYGRHYYVGRDEHGRSERLFTPLPLEVGKLYLFYPLTNPVRINPLIFPLQPGRR